MARGRIFHFIQRGRASNLPPTLALWGGLPRWTPTPEADSGIRTHDPFHTKEVLWPTELCQRTSRNGEIRTHDPLTPNQVRYQTALRSVVADLTDRSRRRCQSTPLYTPAGYTD
jgi:hypothetical protein